MRGWYKGTTAHLARIAPHTVSVSPSHAATDLALMLLKNQVITLVANEFITRHWVEHKAASAAKLD